MKSVFALAATMGLTGVPAPSSAQNPSVDRKAVILLQEMERAMAAVVSLGAVLTVKRTLDSKTDSLGGFAKLMRPGYARVVLKGKLGQTIAADGRQVWVYNASTDQYLKRKADSTGKDLAKTLGPLIPLALFFDSAALSANAPKGARLRVEKPSTRAGVRFDVLAFTAPSIEIRLFLSPNRLVKRSITTAVRGDRVSSVEVELSQIYLNSTLSKASFAYSPPKTARELAGPVQVEVVQPSGK